jgi:hypothetical protein
VNIFSSGRTIHELPVFAFSMNGDKFPIVACTPHTLQRKSRGSAVRADQKLSLIKVIS